MSRLVIINTCSDCPHFDYEYWSYYQECKLLKRKIERDEQTYELEIPEDCPLEKVNE